MPRTGTLSLKHALEQLGFAKCHHMVELLQNPGEIPGFVQAAAGGQVEWDSLYAGYRAGVDWPTGFFWRQLVDYYPQAKVILSRRDPAAWFASFSSTVLADMRSPPPVDGPGLELRLALEPLARAIARGVFDDKLDDSGHILQVYEEHNRRVQEIVPAERLLVFDPAQGWGPLCDFLDLPVPATDYPHANTTENFQEMTAHLRGE